MSDVNDPTLYQQLGRAQADIHHLSSQIATLQATVSELNVSLAEIKETLSQAKGGWRTLMMLAGFVSAISGFIGWFAGKSQLLSQIIK